MAKTLDDCKFNDYVVAKSGGKYDFDGDVTLTNQSLVNPQTLRLKQFWKKTDSPTGVVTSGYDDNVVISSSGRVSVQSFDGSGTITSKRGLSGVWTNGPVTAHTVTANEFSINYEGYQELKEELIFAKLYNDTTGEPSSGYVMLFNPVS